VRPQRADDLRHRVGLTGAGGAQSGRHRRDEGGWGVLGELDLELPEPRREAGPVDERHLVVDDLGQLAPMPVAEHHDLALGVEVCDEPDRRRARERAHEVERSLGRLAGFTVDVDLLACEAVVERDR